MSKEERGRDRERPMKLEKKDEIHLPKQINTGTYILHPHTYPKANTLRVLHRVSADGRGDL